MTQQNLKILQKNFREIGDRLIEGGTIGNLAVLYANSGRLREAEEGALEALRIAGEIGNRHTAVTAISNMTVWGNHSATQYPDLFNTRVDGKAAMELVDQDWYEGEFIPTVQQRGAAIIAARGASSAASAANAAIDHMRNWVLGTPGDDWVSMGIYSDGSYGITEGLIYSFPCRCNDGAWEIVQGLEINDFSRARMQATEQELTEERDAVQHLLP